MQNVEHADLLHREAIKVTQNKREDYDYIVIRHDVVETHMIAGVSNKTVDVFIHFVPDRHLLHPIDGLKNYFEKISAKNWDSPEDFAQRIVDDLNNELVPRWLRLQVRFDKGHELIFEDRQPNWRNDGLLAQLLISV